MGRVYGFAHPCATPEGTYKSLALPAPSTNRIFIPTVGEPSRKSINPTSSLSVGGTNQMSVCFLCTCPALTKPGSIIDQFTCFSSKSGKYSRKLLFPSIRSISQKLPPSSEKYGMSTNLIPLIVCFKE